MENEAGKLKNCHCGNQRIASSFGKNELILFCPECGRYATAKDRREVIRRWNSGFREKDEKQFRMSAPEPSASASN